MTEVIGMSSTIGVAVGGALVAVAGVASGLAHGVVRGASVGSNVVQLALPSANEDQASTSYLSVGDSAEVSNAPVGRQPEGDGGRRTLNLLTERPSEVGTERRFPRCHVCWNPHLGNVRPIYHTYAGDCKLATSTPSVAAASAAAPGSDVKNSVKDAAAAVFHARTEAALITRLPDSQGSLFGSVKSETDG